MVKLEYHTHKKQVRHPAVKDSIETAPITKPMKIPEIKGKCDYVLVVQSNSFTTNRDNYENKLVEFKDKRDLVNIKTKQSQQRSMGRHAFPLPRSGWCSTVTIP